MFRFYELYSLYLKKMSNYGSSSTTWCLCEKLPRSILHIAPTPSREHWCEVCGRRRRPRACFSSSSDEEERAAERRQVMLAEQRRQAEEKERQGLVRVKVAMATKKPRPKSQPHHKSNCFKCGGQQKPPMNLMQSQQQIKLRCNNRLHMGRFGHCRKPQRVQCKRRDGDFEVESQEQLDIEPHPTAPPPPPSPPKSPPPPTTPGCGESLWEQRHKDMPNLVAFAHEVFNRPLHLRKRQPNSYDNLFVSDFIPLEKPITDAAGGAISKRRRLFGRPLRPHYSRPLPPLSQVLSQILAKQKVRAKGGGLPAKEELNKTASQFPPFDCYEGPSEDALVVESARHMLRQPKALHIMQRRDLPTTRLPSFESEPSSDCSSSSPFDMPTAPPAERPRQSYTVGAPLRLHEMMKAVAQSGLSDSSASSSSTGSSSHKSASSTLPVLQQSVRSRGGEEPPYEEKPAEPAVEPLTIMEKILWLMEQKPTVDVDPTEHKLESNQIKDNHTESVKALLQFMERLHIDGGDKDDTHSGLLKNDIEDELKTSVDTPLTELQLSNDMSNEMPLNSSNKSEGDAKYVNGFSNGGTLSEMTDSGGITNSKRNSSTSMWSIISGFFTSKRSKDSSLTNSSLEEMKPLKVTKNLQYGSINQHRTKEELYSCRENV
ncbi:uncharacterized protein LOC117794487 [Drosophila innubila]|uniref:uncharacterized protein LOC117794487 n=1 Tax=Drosophila innubila TaxID=198719 RepID=UPI00148B60B9|nr:uncharacterized protein LOC117794487 [Drosophila innubila]